MRSVLTIGSRAWLQKQLIIMASGSTKVPPLFNENEMDYEQWKKDIDLWTVLTDLDKRKHAIAVHLSLTGRARKATSELSVDEMKSDNGLATLLTKLDRVFLQDKNWKCFNTYLAFENYRREEKCTIDEYLSEFDLRHYKLKECGVNLPDAVIACRLLKSCGLSDMHFQLALSTTVDMTFENMRATLKKLFAESGHMLTSDHSSSIGDIKIEPVLECDTYYASGRTRGGPQRRGMRGGYFSSRQSSSGKYSADAPPPQDKRVNPRNLDGSISLCAICGSRMHWAKACPHAYEKQKHPAPIYYGEEAQDFGEEVQITLFSEEKCNRDTKMESLLGETIGFVLLDSGCSKTVCGEMWLQYYLDTLTDTEKASIKFESSSSFYRFGDGARMKAEKCLILPCVLAGTPISIRTDVVSSNIPLLLSRSSMKKAGMIIDLSCDQATVFGKQVQLGTTSMGHYILPIVFPLTKQRVELILFNDARDTNFDQMAVKLHKQFAHPTVEKLKKLLQDAGIDDKELYRSIDRISNSCDTCIRYKKQRPRPVVAMSMARVFNETVAMDLKIWRDGLYFLVIIDLATRFCTASVIANKKAETIVEKLFTCWIVLFGAPKQFLSDNGGEFNNVIMRSLADSFGIKLNCTSAESPWSNSVCERLNCVLGIGVQKVMHDAKCNVHTALAWTVAARNALHNCHGYSPNQLVFGYNPALPNVFSGAPPQLESSSSEIVAQHLTAMHAARADFLKNESNEKIKRALKHQIRVSDVEDLQSGDPVFYKRRDSDCWHGPGVVIGKDGKQVLVRHGGIYVRVHTCRLQHANDSTVPKDLSTEEAEIQQPSYAPDAESEDESSRKDGSAEFVTPSRSHSEKPKIGQIIECFPKDGGATFTAKIISRAGKAGGIYGNCYNIMKENGDMDWIDLVRQVEKWRPYPDGEQLLMCTGNSSIHEAKLNEYENWKQNKVFQEVSDDGQDAISVRWVITEKLKGDNRIIKARLVARGFEENFDNKTDSPTCAKDTLRVVMSVIACHGWVCHSIDIKAAFLQGEPINRDLYIRPPPEFNTGKLWKLKKTVYGLCDAARAWYFRVKRALLDMGMKMSSLDNAMFLYLVDDAVTGVICIHVDDFCWAGDDIFKTAIIDPLQEQFLIGHISSKAFKYIGLNMMQESNGSITLNQNDYITTLQEIDVDNVNARHRSEDATDNEKKSYRALVGQLNWVATQTRPDVSYEVCELSSVFDTAKIDDLLKANKVVRKLKSTLVDVIYPKLDDKDHLTIECYSDAAFGNLSDGGSQGGYIIFITDCNGRRCPVSWQSKRVRRVVKSTLAAETLALLDSAEAGVYIAALLAEILGCAPGIVVRCFVDNKSLVEALYSTKSIEDKHLRISLAVLRDMLNKHSIHSVAWVQSSHQLANVLTKRGACAKSLLYSIGGCLGNH